MIEIERQERSATEHKTLQVLADVSFFFIILMFYVFADVIFLTEIAFKFGSGCPEQKESIETSIYHVMHGWMEIRSFQKMILRLNTNVNKCHERTNDQYRSTCAHCSLHSA